MLVLLVGSASTFRSHLSPSNVTLVDIGRFGFWTYKVIPHGHWLWFCYKIHSIWTSLLDFRLNVILLSHWHILLLHLLHLDLSNIIPAFRSLMCFFLKFNI